jgi:uncharacterized protein (TIGR03437 family)
MPKDYSVGLHTTSVAAGDFNGDNKLDLVVGATADPFGAVLLNDGAGGFGPAINLPRGNSPFPTSTVDAVDLDGDGKLDLLFRKGPEIQTYKGDGAGGFTPQPLLLLPFTQANGMGDFNGDGKPDLYFLGGGFQQGELLVYLNDGSGRFGTPVSTPLGGGFNPGETGVVADDFNGDGKTDIILRAAGVTLFTAIGNGRFNAPTTYLSNLASFTMKTGDYNRDGRPDVFSLNNTGRLTVLTSQGSGFAAPRGYSFSTMGSALTAGAVESGDLNGDGVTDLAVAATNFVGAFLMFGDGRGEFGQPVAVGGGDVTGGGARALAIRDFNRDGKPDLAILNSDTQNVIVLLGDGRGGFARSATLNIGNNAQDLAAADFNGDGNLDLVAKGQSGGLALFIGNGQGSFTPSSSGIGGNLAFFTFTAGDFNGDGKADLALSDDYQVQPPDGNFRLTVLPGDGMGGFGAPINLMFEGHHAAFIKAADLNLDSRDDLVFTIFDNATVFVALSNPGGAFAAPVRYQTNGVVGRSVTARDVNGDGKLDLIFANNQSGTISILLGKGDGGFNAASVLPVFDSPGLMAAGDFDEDGAIDLAIAHSGSSLVGMLLNKSSCVPAGGVVPASAASFARNRAAPESIVSLFGANLATGTQSAPLPLPTMLAGASVKIKDSAGVERLSPLFYVSPEQINYLMPAGTTPGVALITVTNGGNIVATGTILIVATSPGIFTADSSGQGLASALVLRVKAGGSQVYEPTVRFDPAQNRFVAVPIDLSNTADQVFLILFGTGIRGRSAISAVSAKIGAENTEVVYAGDQFEFEGLDQVNLRLSPTLRGRGEVAVELMLDGRTANTVKVNVK